MNTINIEITLPATYYDYIANKYGWIARIPQGELFNIEDESLSKHTFCKNWLKNKIFKEILEPEYIDVKRKEITDIELKINNEARKLVDFIQIL